MATRMGRTEPFQSGQQTNARDKGEKVPIKFKGSMDYHGGTKDPLHHALAGKPPMLPDDIVANIHSRESKPSGVRYDPMQSYGKIRGHASPATDYKSHQSRPGNNALGHNSNRVGSKSGYPHFAPRGGGKKP